MYVDQISPKRMVKYRGKSLGLIGFASVLNRLKTQHQPGINHLFLNNFGALKGKPSETAAERMPRLTWFRFGCCHLSVLAKVQCKNDARYKMCRWDTVFTGIISLPSQVFRFFKSTWPPGLFLKLLSTQWPSGTRYLCFVFSVYWTPQISF